MKRDSNGRLQISLKPALVDLLQHCELRCSAGCCGWDAFDLSEHWIRRWCEARESDHVTAASEESSCIQAEISGRDLDELVRFGRFFNPSVRSLADHLASIQVILATQDGL